MSDCIRREVAVNALDTALRCGAVIDYCGMETAIDIIRELPTADVAEVVRCKDCKHWNKRSVSGEWPDKVTCYCKITQHCMSKGWKSYTAPDDYCSFAERGDGK